jgi:hypothetical protein
MDKVVKLVFSPEAEEAYEGLIEKATRSKTERSVAKAIHTKIELIRSNYHYGNPIAKNLIPDEYKVKYGVTNLFRVELPDYWRMLYTLTDGEREIEIIAFILDILDHRKYDKKLGYVSK